MKKEKSLQDIRFALELIKSDYKEKVVFETEDIIVTGKCGIPQTITLKEKAVANLKKFIKEQEKRFRKNKKIGKVTTFCGVPIFITKEK